MVLGRVDEVLAVEPDDESRHEEDRGDRRQPLDDLVLVDRDARLLVVARGREQIARVLHAFGGAEQLVVRRRELLLDLPREDLAREQGPAFDVDPAVDDLAHRIPGRRQGLADVQQVVPDLRDSPARLLGGPRVDAFFELVDLLVDRVEQVDVALSDVVDEKEGDHARRLLVLERFTELADVARVERGALAGRLANRDDPLAAEDEVDLLVVDDVLLGHGDRGEQEAEDVVAVALDARAQARGRRGLRAASARPTRRRATRAERARAAALRRGRADRSRRYVAIQRG